MRTAFLALLLVLTALGVLAGVAVSVVSAGGGTLTGGGTSKWNITNKGGTDNGLPAGGSCDGSPGFTVTDADIPAGGDAYDNGQMIWVDGTVFAAPGPVSPVGQTLTAGPVAMSGLDVTMEYYAATGTATSRTFVTLANPGGSPVSASVAFVTNVGSDSSTVLETTSSGDATFTTADRWAITSDGAPFGDPVITHVLFGPGSPAETPSSVSQTVFDCAATNGIRGAFDITVPAGGTRALMFFNQMSADDTGAISGTADFDTNPPVGGDLLDGLSTTQLGEALNWNFGLAPPTPTPPAVLLVHGWRGTCGSMAAIKQYLESSGYPANRVECFDPPDSKSFWGYLDACLGRHGAARELRNYIAGFRQRAGVGSNEKIDIVAHSFGGIVARTYIKGLGGDANVRKLIMLGTPNWGTPVSGPLFAGQVPLRRCPGLFGIQLPARDRALADMEPAFMGLMNLGYLLDPPSASYQVIAGTADNNVVLNLFGPNDCVVTVASARGVGFPLSTFPVKHAPVHVICPSTSTSIYSDTVGVLPAVLSALSSSSKLHLSPGRQCGDRATFRCGDSA